MAKTLGVGDEFTVVDNRWVDEPTNDLLTGDDYIVDNEVLRELAHLNRIWVFENKWFVQSLNVETYWLNIVRFAGRVQQGTYCTHTWENQSHQFNVSLESKFKRLAEQWRNETGFISSITKKSSHPAYIHIIGMGPDVVPILLRELDNNLDHWFFALYAITEEDPVKPEDEGNIERMAQAWLEWGRQRGII